MRKLLRNLWKDEKGQDLVEYALLVVLVALGAVLAMKALASAISDAFSTAAANLTTSSECRSGFAGNHQPPAARNQNGGSQEPERRRHSRRPAPSL